MAVVSISKPAKVTLENISKTEKVGFVPYKENFTTYLSAGDKIEIIVEKAEQVLYYLAQASDKLAVTQATAE